MAFEFTSRTRWWLLLGVVALGLAYLIRDVLVLVFIAAVLASVLQPAVHYLVAKRWPKSLAILLWYFIAIGLLTFIFAVMIPPITEQLSQLYREIPYSYQPSSNSQISTSIVAPSLLEQFVVFLSRWRDAVGSLGGGLLGTMFGLFGGFVSFLSVLVMAFYMLLEKDGLKKIVGVLTTEPYRARTVEMFERMQDKMSLWIRGQLLLMLVVALLTYIALLILDVRYALVLALLAGLLEIVPVIGPITAGLPAVVIAFSQSPIKAVVVLVTYIVVQQVENHILVPKVMSKSLGFSPLIIIIAILIGAKLGGVIGILLAVPVLTALSVLWEERESLVV